MNKLYILILSLIISITPIKINASTIYLNKSEMILGVGHTEALTVTLSNDLNSSNIIWHSSNERIAKVNSKGEISGITEGTAYISASINGMQSTCKVVISSTYVPVQGITLNKTTINLLVGETETLIKNIQPENATNKDVNWHSSNTNVATIDKNGKVTAKKVGTAIITVYTQKKQVSCTVNVVDKIELKGISLNKNTLTLKEKTSEILKIQYTPSNATNKNITWQSSNKNIATVDSSGKVTGISPGTAKITVISKDGGFVSECKVIVEAISKKITGVSLDKKELKINAGEESTLKATINPSYAENKNITWESSNEEVAIVKDGKITAIKPGDAEIKVITDDGKKEAICKITVLSPPIKSIKFQEEEMTVYIDSETKLETINEPKDSIMEEPVWISSNETVATIENGLLKALNIGEATITITNKEKTISAAINIKVIPKPKEKLSIKIEGYNLNFEPDIKNYTLEIGSEQSLNIITNIDNDKVRINGNQNLKNGSIITINITNEEKATYVINIKKKENYTIYFIAIISILLLINLIRIFIKSKKKK